MIGKKVRNVSKAQAFDAIFGYTIMLDVTARGYGLSKNLSGTRNVRKGFESFAPIGPWITTKDEIADPHNLWMKLWINGELKQSAKTDAMINDIATLISFLSRSHDLVSGDLITTGNPDSPEFQEKLKPGDVLKSEIEGIGAMTSAWPEESNRLSLFTGKIQITMIRIAPFRGVSYNQKKIRDLSKVIAPPYDVISKEEQDKLYKKSPYNFVRLDLSQEPDSYGAVARTAKRVASARHLGA